jgi:hypothetical protein
MQALFDSAIEDWHGSGKMGGEMHLKASGLNHGVERPTIRNPTTGITLVVNTKTLDDRVWGRWGKQGLETFHVRSSHASDSKGGSTRSKKGGTQGGQVATSKGAKASRCVELPGVESIRTVDNLRQRLCNEFGKCVVLVWVPCDLNGRPKLLGQDSLVRAITSNAAWNAAKNEVGLSVQVQVPLCIDMCPSPFCHGPQVFGMNREIVFTCRPCSRHFSFQSCF